ncbi:MAG TPA: nucleotide exchange factor GrpE [Candidatus Acidoferrales bacterium]|nr:nucleotide exchange factor GrpE [Candidatus Acidoferrales bacterium]
MSKRHKAPEDPAPGATLENAEEAGVEAGLEAGSDSAPAADPESPEAQLATKDAEIAELKDKYLRALADSENARKRIRQQADESVRIQRENILRDLLPIIDNLERALAAARDGTDAKTVVDGVAMTVRSLHDYLRAQGVTPLASVGQAFDPARHEAVDQVESQVHPANTVVDEFHRGYLIGERVLRPARVTVAKNTGIATAGRNGGENDASDIEKN